MDQEILVKEAQELTQELDNSTIKPRGVIVIYPRETSTPKIWIVPSDEKIDKREFYQKVSSSISSLNLTNIDSGMVVLKYANSVDIKGFLKLINTPGISSIYMAGNSYNGIMLPDGVIIRMT